MADATVNPKPARTKTQPVEPEHRFTTLPSLVANMWKAWTCDQSIHPDLDLAVLEADHFIIHRRPCTDHPDGDHVQYVIHSGPSIALLVQDEEE